MSGRTTIHETLMGGLSVWTKPNSYGTIGAIARRNSNLAHSTR